MYQNCPRLIYCSFICRNASIYLDTKDTFWAEQKYTGSMMDDVSFILDPNPLSLHFNLSILPMFLLCLSHILITSDHILFSSACIMQVLNMIPCTISYPNLIPLILTFANLNFTFLLFFVLYPPLPPSSKYINRNASLVQSKQNFCIVVKQLGFTYIGQHDHFHQWEERVRMGDPSTSASKLQYL